MPKAHIVKCLYCQKSFDTNKEESVLVNSRRYAHKSCYENFLNQQSEEEKDKRELEEYIKILFKQPTINAKIQKQINKYIKENQYTYSGIRRSLVYFYDVQKHGTEEANNGIGIVPYIYDNARQYYYNLWLAQQRNEDKDIELYKPKEVIVSITSPKRQIKKRKIFMFLDKEEESDS